MRRRRFLTGMGGLAVGLPFLRKFASDAQAGMADDAPTRVIVMTYAMGTHVPMWRPTATGSNFELGSIMTSMEPFKDRSLYISNTPHSVLDVGGSAYVWGHPAKKEATLTGTLMQSSFTGDGSNHIDNAVESSPDGFDRTPNNESVENLIGDRLRDPGHTRGSVDLGIFGPGGVRDAATSDFFYEGPANPVTVNAHPGLALASVFNGVNPDDNEPDEAWLALQRRRKSVLDGVRDAFVDLRQGLDREDRATLDDHADKIRQIELDTPPLIACSLPDGIPDDDNAYAGMSMSDLGPLQNRIMAHAMGCSLAPIGRIEYLDQHDPFFGIPEVDDAPPPEQGWHAVVHAQPSEGWAPDHPVRIRGFTFFAEMFADLCTQLDSLVEGPDGRTVLDNSLVVLASDYGEGDGHGSHDMCFLVVGNSGPGRRGYHFDGSGHNVNRVLTSLVHMAGATDVTEFGMQGFGGTVINELLT